MVVDCNISCEYVPYDVWEKYWTYETPEYTTLKEIHSRGDEPGASLPTVELGSRGSVIDTEES